MFDSPPPTTITSGSRTLTMLPSARAMRSSYCASAAFAQASPAARARAVPPDLPRRAPRRDLLRRRRDAAEQLVLARQARARQKLLDAADASAVARLPRQLGGARRRHWI